MAKCEIIPLATGACSGKCLGARCSDKASRLWIVAACEGMVSLFSKEADGSLALSVQQDRPAVFSSLEQFQQSLASAHQKDLFDQLIIIGSASDIAWVHSSMPRAAAHQIAAEIKYPLLPSWFKDRTHLAQALQKVLEH